MKDLVVVSLFDGLSGGRIALSRIPRINVLRYYSSEVDHYAIKIANKNYPQDTPYRLGDVTKIDGKALKATINKEFPGAQILLIGGSPCQGFSLAGKLKGSCTKEGVDVTTLPQYLKLKSEEFEFDGQSYLFWEYIRLAHELEVDYYLLENVRVTSKWLPMFNDAMGVEPILINSSLVSAQNRQRYYWTNIPNVVQPEDRGIILRDILEPIDIITPGTPALVPEATKKGYTEVEPGDCVDLAQPNSKTRRGRNMKDKSNCLLTSHEFHRYLGRPRTLRDFKETSLCHHAADADDIRGPYLVDGVRQDGHQLTAGLTEQMLEVRSDEKTNCLTTVQKDNYITYELEEGSRTPIKECEGFYRKLTPLECERLQTLPDNYTEGVSNSQRYKMIGNGWTIEVISHILKEIK